MKFSFFEEFIRLLLLQCDKKPESFVAFFDHSDFLIGYYYSCSENIFTHVSSSFQKILGYHQNNILCNDNFYSNIIHPHDEQNLKDSLKITTVSDSHLSHFSNYCNVYRTKCRARHIKGYWKYFIIFSVDCWNLKTNSTDRIGLFAVEHVKHYYPLISKDKDSIQLRKSKSKINSDSQELIKYNNIITPRESEILELISEGMIAKEIAKKLNISLSTVISHRKNLISKFEVHNTAELINTATKLMLV
ncbi:MAG: hypothetical protein KAR57_00860 [Bacteroidales bacterium]|nr:hypothetical protein [Bacteroidales bacterium]